MEFMVAKRLSDFPLVLQASQECGSHWWHIWDFKFGTLLKERNTFYTEFQKHSNVEEISLSSLLLKKKFKSWIFFLF